MTLYMADEARHRGTAGMLPCQADIASDNDIANVILLSDIDNLTICMTLYNILVRINILLREIVEPLQLLARCKQGDESALHR